MEYMLIIICAKYFMQVEKKAGKNEHHLLNLIRLIILN